MTNKTIALVMAATASWPVAAAVQSGPDYEAIVRVMRECARLAEIPARVACYDETMRTEARISQRTPAPAGRLPSPAAPSQTQAQDAPRATGFGAESLPETAVQRAAVPEREEIRVTAIRELHPRSYAFTLADGGQWEFTDQAPLTYDAPRVGASIVLRRGAIGGYMLEYAGQASIRVRRVR